MSLWLSLCSAARSPGSLQRLPAAAVSTASWSWHFFSAVELVLKADRCWRRAPRHRTSCSAIHFLLRASLSCFIDLAGHASHGRAPLCVRQRRRRGWPAAPLSVNCFPLHDFASKMLSRFTSALCALHFTLWAFETLPLVSRPSDAARRHFQVHFWLCIWASSRGLVLTFAALATDGVVGLPFGSTVLARWLFHSGPLPL